MKQEKQYIGGYEVPDYALFMRNRRYVLLLSIVAIVGLLGLYHPSLATTTRDKYESYSLTRKGNLRRIDNGTLGFGAIYALSLPDRSDKRDAMELAASVTGLHITWADGVLGAKMNEKAIPPIHNDPESFPGKVGLRNDGELGCWRGHMNIIRDVVTKGLSSALIIEDDADWDVNIVHQMQQFALATQDVLKTRPYQAPTKTPTYSMPDSPYGKDWDILWIGHCGGWAPNAKFHNSKTIIRNDQTVPPVFDIVDLTRNLEASNLTCSTWLGNDPEGRKCDSPRLAPNERIVQLNGSPLCTAAYAVSQQGARKMLANIGGSSLIDVDAPIDTEMTELCRGDKDHGDVDLMRCVSVSPPYFMPHKAKGPKSGDSDINTFSSGDMRKVGVSKGLVWSAKLNAPSLIMGLEPESQYTRDEKDSKWRYKEFDEYGV